MNVPAPHAWPRHVLDDALALILGDPLAEGMDRVVFEHRQDPSLVVKIETRDGDLFQNVIEWVTWNDLRETRFAKYLAPCHAISPNGRALVMTRVEPLEEGRQVRLPSFLTDLKVCNYGLLEGRVVACDYGANLLLNHGAFGSKLRRVKLTEDR